MKRLLKWIGLLALIILLVILLVVGCLYVFAGTEKGFSLAANQATSRVEGLALGKVGGNLLSGIESDSVEFENDSIKLTAKGIASKWRLSCLAKKEFCLDKLVIDSVAIETFATNTETAPSTGPIEIPDIQLPIGANIKEVFIRQLSVKLPGDAPALIIDDISLSARTDGNTVIIENLSVAYQDYSAGISGNVTLENDYPLDFLLDLDAKDILPDELPEGKGNQATNIRIHLSQSLRNLNIASDITGAINANLSGSVQPLDSTIPANLELSTRSLGWPILSKTQVSATNTNLTIKGSMEDYTLNLFTRVQGEELPTSTIQLSAIINTKRALVRALSVDTLDGTATGQAEVSWLNDLDWNTQWSFSDINPGVYRSELAGKLAGTVKASGTAADGNWTLDVQQARIAGELQKQLFDLDVKLFKGKTNIWEISQAALKNGKNLINAKGTVSDSWDLTADAQLPELQSLLPALGGSLNAKLTVTGALQKPSVILNASSGALSFNDVKVSGLSLRADVKELLDKDSDISLAIGSATVGENTVQNGRFNLTGSRTKHAFSLFADGPQATSIELNSSGSLSDQLDWNGSLDSVTLEVPAHVIELNKPTAISWSNQVKKLAIDPHCWVTEGSNLCLENEVLAESSGTVTLSLDQYALNRLNPFLPAQTTMTGQLALNSTIKWGEDQTGGFAATLQSSITDGGAQVLDANNDAVRFTYDLLELDSEVNPERVDADIRLTSRNIGKANVVFTMDPSAQEKPISGSVNLNGFDIGVAKAFLPDFDVIEGLLNIDGAVSGNLTDPRFDGEIVLEQLVVQAEFLPLPITGGEIVTTMKGRRAFIDGSLASNNGSIDIEGSLNWRELSAWAASVTLTGEKLNIQSDPVQESHVNHRIKINAVPGRIQVNGTVEIPRAVIDVAELPQGAARVSSDVIVIEDIDETVQLLATNDKNANSSMQLFLDVDVSLGDDVELSAYGLNANLKGDMSIRQRSPNPLQLGGEIEVVDGIYKQYGQNLEARGQILFVGPINQTRLAIDAVRTIDTEDRVAGLRIQGTLTTPEIILFTEPGDKPQDSILSYIVLGRDINETTDQEANLLAAAALALTVRGGRTIAGGIASALGVKDFAFETRGNGDDTELVISGRLNDRLLLRYGRSVFQPLSTLYLRYDLTKKLYLEAAQSSLEQAVDLFFSFSF
jgi:translocation and assembly module TamB